MALSARQRQAQIRRQKSTIDRVCVGSPHRITAQPRDFLEKVNSIDLIFPYCEN